MLTKNILIIDDDEIICTLLKFRLEELGYQAFYSQHPEEIFYLIEKYNPGILILDIFMPEKDGIEIILDLKARACSPYIIGITSQLAYLDAIKTLGANEAFPKNEITPILDSVKKRLSQF